MRKSRLGLGAVGALALTLAACGGTNGPENNFAVNDLNAMPNLEAMPPAEPAANVAVEETVTEVRQSEPAAAKPAPAKPSPPKPKPAPATPKPNPAEQPNAPDPTCAPEHRAAGHC